MPRSDTMPLLAEAEPYPGAPRCFRRPYDMHGNVLIAGGETQHLADPGTWIVIYGYSCRSRFAEDRPHEQDVWASRRAFPALCFSEAEPQGEWGFVPLDAVTEIDEAELRAAAAKLGTEV